MPLDNYREVPIEINGVQVEVGGFARPGIGRQCLENYEELYDDHEIEAVISLADRYDDEREHAYAAGIQQNFFFAGPGYEVEDYFGEPFENTERIEAVIYDNIYDAVCEAQEAGFKIAIHCGAGAGRTGTALAALKLRELLERENLLNPIYNNEDEMRETERIHVHKGAIGDADRGQNVFVTAIVKEAIEWVRAYDNAGHQSVETVNDAVTLLHYEWHLRNEIALENRNGDEMQDEIIQQDAAIAAINNGVPQPIAFLNHQPLQGIHYLQGSDDEDLEEAQILFP